MCGLLRSPGYALTLLAESTTSAIHSSEVVSVPPSSTTSSPSSEQVRLCHTSSICIQSKKDAYPLSLLLLLSYSHRTTRHHNNTPPQHNPQNSPDNTRIPSPPRRALPTSGDKQRRLHRPHTPTARVDHDVFGQ